MAEAVLGHVSRLTEGSFLRVYPAHMEAVTSAQSKPAKKLGYISHRVFDGIRYKSAAESERDRALAKAAIAAAELAARRVDEPA